MPSALRAEIAAADANLAALTGPDGPQLLVGVGRSGLVVDPPLARPLLCSSGLNEVADPEAFGAGLAQTLFAQLEQKRRDLVRWERLRLLEAQLPQHARLVRLAAGGTWWKRLGLSVLNGTVGLNDWLGQVVQPAPALGSAAPLAPGAPDAELPADEHDQGNDDMGYSSEELDNGYEPNAWDDEGE